MTDPSEQALPVASVDAPGPRETFADSIGAMVWDGQTLRVEFCVTRYPERPGSEALRRYPAARLVLTVPVVVELFDRLQRTVQILPRSVSNRPAEAGQQGGWISR